MGLIQTLCSKHISAVQIEITYKHPYLGPTNQEMFIRKKIKREIGEIIG